MKTRIFIIVIAALLFPATFGGCTREVRIKGLTAEAERAQEQGNYEHALKCWSLILKLNPDDSYAYAGRAMAHDIRAEWDLALSDYSNAIRLGADDAGMYSQRGTTYSRKGEFENAVRDLEQSAAMDPDDPEILNNLAWFRATCLAEKFRDGKTAVEAATRACELSEWKSGTILDTLAAAYAETGNFEKAIQYQTQSLTAEGIPPGMIQGMHERLSLYQKHQPCREPSH